MFDVTISEHACSSNLCDIFIQNIRGGLARLFVRRLRARNKILACYRHWKMKVYLQKIIEAFR